MSEYEGKHESRDVPARVPVYVIVFTAVFVPLGALGVWLTMGTVWRAPDRPPPLFTAEPAQQAMPEPALQQSPPADLARMNAEHARRLQSAGWIDREAGIVHMPIDRAMDLLQQRGLPPPAPDWRPQPGRAPPSRQDGSPQDGGSR